MSIEWVAGAAAGFFLWMTFFAADALIRQERILFHFSAGIATVAWIVLVRAFYGVMS